MSEPLRIPPPTIDELTDDLLGNADLSAYDARIIAKETHDEWMAEIYRMARLGESLQRQVAGLAAWIIANIPGEPSASEGAVDCAIRIMAIQKEAINESVKLTVRQAEDLQRAREAYIAATNPGIDMDEVRRTRDIPRANLP